MSPDELNDTELARPWKAEHLSPPLKAVIYCLGQADLYNPYTIVVDGEEILGGYSLNLPRAAATVLTFMMVSGILIDENNKGDLKFIQSVIDEMEQILPTLYNLNFLEQFQNDNLPSALKMPQLQFRGELEANGYTVELNYDEHGNMLSSYTVSKGDFSTKVNSTTGSDLNNYMQFDWSDNLHRELLENFSIKSFENVNTTYEKLTNAVLLANRSLSLGQKPLIEEIERLKNQSDVSLFDVVNLFKTYEQEFAAVKISVNEFYDKQGIKVGVSEASGKSNFAITEAHENLNTLPLDGIEVTLFLLYSLFTAFAFSKLVWPMLLSHLNRWNTTHKTNRTSNGSSYSSQPTSTDLSQLDEAITKLSDSIDQEEDYFYVDEENPRRYKES